MIREARVGGHGVLGNADRLVEWVKGLLAVPFVLYSQPHGVFEGQGMSSLAQTREEAHRRYSEILRDVEVMIDDHSEDATRPVQLLLLIHPELTHRSCSPE